MRNLNNIVDYWPDYKARLLAIMRENSQLGIDNGIYSEVLQGIVNNRSTFYAVYHYSQSQL